MRGAFAVEASAYHAPQLRIGRLSTLYLGPGAGALSSRNQAPRRSLFRDPGTLGGVAREASTREDLEGGLRADVAMKPRVRKVLAVR